MAQNKYVKQKRQYSPDGNIWYDFDPMQYRPGRLIEENSEDCKDTPTPPIPPPPTPGGYDPDAAKPYSERYFTIDIIEGGEIKQSDNYGIQYSLNGGEWKSLDNTSLYVNAGDKVRMKNTKDHIYRDSTITNSIFVNPLPKCHLYGNINSMYAGDNFKTNVVCYQYMFQYWFSSRLIYDTSNLILPYMELANECYRSMFRNCTSLQTAPQLPATELADNCYCYMFYNCNITTAPELPATTLDKYCYWYMFSNCSSLTKAPALPATTLAEGCYSEMFAGCTTLTEAPILPATKLVYRCYNDMFSNCTSLQTAPQLPATELAEECYYGMFGGCNALVNAPQLPATELADNCYCYMFRNCKSLTTAPVLIAKKSVYRCYNNMFYWCQKLNYIKCLAEDLSARQITSYWVSNVSQTGTFVKKRGVEWERGEHGIPEGWTIEEVD